MTMRESVKTATMTGAANGMLIRDVTYCAGVSKREDAVDAPGKWEELCEILWRRAVLPKISVALALGLWVLI